MTPSARTKSTFGRLPALAAMFVLVLAGFWLRIYHLGLQAAMGDDAFTLMIGQQHLSGLFDLSKNEPHPPFFYLLLHFWQLASGSSEFAGRYLSLCFGVLCLAALYRLGRALVSDGLGLLAALLATANPFLIVFSQQVRMYTLVVLLSIASSYLLVEVTKSARPSRWLLYFAASLLAVYTHFFAFFVLVGQGAFVLLTAAIAMPRARASSAGPYPAPAAGSGGTQAPALQRIVAPSFQNGGAGTYPWRLWLKPWLVTQLGLVACYVPWIVIAHDTLTSYTNGLVTSLPLPTMAARLLPTFLTGSASTPVALWLAVLTAVLLLAGLTLAISGHDGTARYWKMPGCSVQLFLGCCLLVPPLAVYLISLVRPMFFERYMVVTLPAFLLTVASGSVAVTGGFARLVRPLVPARGRATVARSFALSALPLGATLLVPANQLLPNYYEKVLYATTLDIRHLVAFIQDNAGPDAAVVINLPPSDPMYRYYAPTRAEFFVPNPSSDAAGQAEAQLDKIVADHSEIWLAPWDFDHTAFVERWLDAHAFRVDQHWFANAEIIRYESSAQSITASGSEATFLAPDARIEMQSSRIGGARILPGSPLLFTLHWQSTGPVAERYKVFVHLLDASNHVITQRDDEPVANKRPTTSWKTGETIDDNYALMVPDTAPSGDYEVEVGLYRLTDGVRLKLSNGDDRVVVGRVTVD